VPAPTFVAERGPDVWNSSTSPKASSAFTPASGDVLVGLALADSNTPQVNLAGGGLTWTVLQSIVVSQYCHARAWSATGAGSSVTGSFSEASNSSNFWGADLLQFSGSDGVGASAQANVASGAPQLAITTTADNSAVVVFFGDWAEVDGSTRSWLAVGGVGPTELAFAQVAGRYTIYAAYYADVGPAGTKTVGLASPGGMKFSIIAVEVKGTAGGGAAQTVSPTGIGTAEALGSLTVTPGPVTVSPVGVGTGHTVGVPAVRAVPWILRIPAGRESNRLEVRTRGPARALFSRIVAPGQAPAVLVTGSTVQEVYKPTAAQVAAADHAFMGGMENEVPGQVVPLLQAAGYVVVPGD